jgi:hypothetical protein
VTFNAIYSHFISASTRITFRVQIWEDVKAACR